MPSTIYFGTLYDTNLPGTSTTTNNSLMSLVPAPDTGMDTGPEGYSEQIDFENGGYDTVVSAGSHRRYQMDWNLRESSGTQGLDLVKFYQQRYYGPGLIYWSNPMNWRTNLFSPSWATPGLTEQGWKTISNLPTTYATDTTGTWGLYKREALYNLSAAVAGVVPTANNQMQVIPVPPGQVLWVHGRSTVGSTGGATYGLIARPMLQNGSYATPVVLTLTNSGNASPTQYSWSSVTYKAVEFYIGILAGGAGGTNYRLGGLDAQLYPVGFTPSLMTMNHQPGQGDTGCKFDGTVSEAYVLVDNTATRRLKGLSADLVEVGAWLQS